MSLESIRESERKSHEEVYSKSVLFEKGSWLYKPVKTVLDVLPLFSDYEKISVLDLGCGVGRNAIPVAQFFADKSCKVDCVDLLELAIDKLTAYSNAYGVHHIINGVLSSIDSFKIEKNSYDFIFAVSALEHVASEEIFINKLFEIRDGIKENGVVCLIVNSDVREQEKNGGKIAEPQFEVNLKTDKLQRIFSDVFSDWSVLKSSVVKQEYDIPRKDFISELSTDVVTYVARK